MARKRGFPIEIPYLEHLGVHLLELGEGTSTTLLDLERHHFNSFEVAHGGALMSLLDVTMAMAGRSLAPQREGEEYGMITIEMKTSFMQPGTGRLIGHGRCVHRTRTLAFCEADVVDGEGKLVARSSGTFKYVKQRKIET